MPAPKWTKNPKCTGKCDGCIDFCYTCNECGSLDEHGRLRKFRCRTTNSTTFDICDRGE